MQFPKILAVLDRGARDQSFGVVSLMFQNRDAVDGPQEVVGVVSCHRIGNVNRMSQRADPLPGGLRRNGDEIAQRFADSIVQTRMARLTTGQKIEQERHVFELVGGVVGGFEQRTEKSSIWPAPGFLTRRANQKIGIMLEATGAAGAFAGPGVRCADREYAILN